MSYETVEHLLARLAADGATTLPASEVAQIKLDEATEDINTFCRRDFSDHPQEAVTVLGSGRVDLLLPSYPLRAVTAVIEDGVAWTTDQVAALCVRSHGVVVRPVAWGFGKIFTLTVDWGYADPPSKAKEACLRLASRKVRHNKVRERIAEGVRSESIEGYAISLDPIEMDRDVALMLDTLRYRRGAR